jgi:hypothetical protein
MGMRSVQPSGNVVLERSLMAKRFTALTLLSDFEIKRFRKRTHLGSRISRIVMINSSISLI